MHWAMITASSGRFCSDPLPTLYDVILLYVGRNGWRGMAKVSEKKDGDSEAWARFERAVDAAVKSGPKHKAGDTSKDVKGSQDADNKRRNRNNVGDDRRG